ncbi:hypothetical protein B8V81_3314 [Paenibacillus pasadenensis]|uniref:Uncharacterized protein n=1 Tax=Paenibacillus pasadenensis TaxID=217090 RepID=A0A2N5N3G6_9BACL|nr:hypothetical protein B8V81_3314 [Paenibacillus pasadenensis]
MSFFAEGKQEYRRHAANCPHRGHPPRLFYGIQASHRYGGV